MEIKKVSGVELKTYDEIGLAFEDMAAGRISGVVCDTPVAANFALQRKEYKEKFRIVGKPFTEEFYGIVVKKGNKELLDLINNGIKSVKSKGLDKAIEKRWLSKTGKKAGRSTRAGDYRGNRRRRDSDKGRHRTFYCVENGFCRRDSLKALDGVSLDIYDGEKVVIIGPSGSGKSTLLRTINRLEDFQRGRIIVDGVDLQADDTDINKVREEIGMVFSVFQPFSP